MRNLAQTISNYGVQKKFLFTVEDLWLGRNIPKVVRCLEEVEKMVKNINSRHKFDKKRLEPAAFIVRKIAKYLPIKRKDTHALAAHIPIYSYTRVQHFWSLKKREG